MKNNNKAYTISRLSEKPKDTNHSLPAQKQRQRKYCTNKGFVVVKEFSFDESAYKSTRKEFDEILDYILKLKDGEKVCFDKVDRLSRSIFDKRVSTLYEKALKDEIELHFVSDNQIINSKLSAVEKFNFGISLGLAKYYSDAISDNVKRANEQKLRKGEWPGKAPLGYLNVDLEGDNKWIEPNGAKADLAIKIFELYATAEYSMFLIRKKLKEEGLFESAGLLQPLSRSQIEHILKNPFYYGVMRYNGQLYPHHYKPLITKELFDTVQEVKASWNKKPFKYAAKPFVYRGLLTCADCGCRITFEIKKGKYIYGHCTNHYKNCKSVVWVKEQIITDQVTDFLKSLTLDDSTLEMLLSELKKNHKYKSDYHKRSMDNLKTQYDKIETRVEKMYTDKLDGSITQEMYDTMLARFKKQQEDILDQMDRHNEADEDYYIKASKLLELAKNSYILFEKAQIEQKRRLLNFVFQNSTLRGEKLEITAKMPFDTIIDCNKTQNWLPG